MSALLKLDLKYFILFEGFRLLEFQVIDTSQVTHWLDPTKIEI